MNTKPSELKHLQRQHVGQLGEKLALQYLESEGYELEAQNWLGKRGELDLVVIKNNILVIVEVRSTSTTWLERPAEATPISKQKQVARCADEYLSCRSKQTHDIENIRFDVIGIYISKELLNSDSTIYNQSFNDTRLSNEKYFIDHVENAYTSPWAF